MPRPDPSNLNATNAEVNASSSAGATSRQSGKFALLVAAGILLSRLSGLVREVVLKRFLGLGPTADAFEAALRIPKLLQNLLGEGALSASFVPVYASLVDDDRETAKRLAGSVFGLLAAAVVAVTGLVVVAAPVFVRLVVWGFTPGTDKYELAVQLTRIMAPGIGFIVLAAWCLGILNSHRKFFLSYVAPALWNITIVAAIFLFARNIDLSSPEDLKRVATTAAWGVMAGGVLQFLVQVPAVLRITGGVRPSLALLPSVRDVLGRFVPAVAGRGVVTLASFVDAALASFLAAGALAAIGAAQVLYLLPISVFALSVANADLPELSREQSGEGQEAGQVEASRRRIEVGAERIAFFLMFSAVAFITMGRLVVGALYERGRFTSDDTMVVWIVLGAYALGMVASGLSRLLQNAAFASGDVKGPARIALYRVLFAVIVGIALMLQFDRIAVIDGALRSVGDVPAFRPVSAALRDATDFRRLGAVGLAFGSMLAAWLELSLLQQRLEPTYGRLSFRRTVGRLWPATVAAGVLGLVLTVLFSGIPVLVAAIGALGLSGIAYVLLANRAQSDTARELLRPIRRRIWRQ